MFTGIIESIGRVRALQPLGGDMRLVIESDQFDMSDVRMGDSICTSGCCLTVVELFDDGYAADVSTESLSMTTLGRWKIGEPVNLEKSLLPTTRMGGHMVSGHVDGVAEVLRRESRARAEEFWLRAPEGCARYIAHKGSVAIDGISLTVNKVDGPDFCLTIIPHTLTHTTMEHLVPGSLVNLEVDQVARYIERLQLSAVTDAG